MIRVLEAGLLRDIVTYLVYIATTLSLLRMCQPLFGKFPAPILKPQQNRVQSMEARGPGRQKCHHLFGKVPATPRREWVASGNALFLTASREVSQLIFYACHLSGTYLR